MAAQDAAALVDPVSDIHRTTLEHEALVPGPARAPSPISDKHRSDMVHLYRAQVGRATMWRRRLDTTTNWAVVTAAAAITFALGDTESQRHVVLLLISVLVTFFLLLEARRYRHYDIWRTRAYILERNYFAQIVDAGRLLPDPKWQHWLAEDLETFCYHISFAEAIGRRLRRNYVWIYVILVLSWFIKVAMHPVPISSIDHFFERAALGPLSGQIMVVVGLLFNLSLITAAAATWYFDPTGRRHQGITIGEVITTHLEEAQQE